MYVIMFFYYINVFFWSLAWHLSLGFDEIIVIPSIATISTSRFTNAFDLGLQQEIVWACPCQNHWLSTPISVVDQHYYTQWVHGCVDLQGTIHHGSAIEQRLGLLGRNDTTTGVSMLVCWLEVGRDLR